MSFTDLVRTALQERIGPGKRFPNIKRMSDELGVDPSQLGRFLKKERGLNADSLGRIMDGLGAELVFPDQAKGAAMDVRFTSMQGQTEDKMPGMPDPGSFYAVPVTTPPVPGAPTTITRDAAKDWLIVSCAHEAIAYNENLLAMRVSRGDTAMAPMIRPNDTILVNPDDRTPHPPGRIMLVADPDPQMGTMIRRVSAKRLDDDMELIFYSENNIEHPPTTYQLNRDYGGDMSRAILGHVVWAWTDMNGK